MTSRSLLYTVITATEVQTQQAATLDSGIETIEIPDEPAINFHLRIFLALFVILTIVITCVGNALVCLAVLLVRKLKHPPNYLIVSLAVADFFVGLIVMPLALADLLFDQWPLGEWMCQLWTTSDLTLCTASIVNLCIISVDRYLVICKPLRYGAQRTTHRMLIYIGIVWLIALSVGFSSHLIASLLENETDHSQVQYTCQVIQHMGYQIYATIISFYGPTLIMIILNVKIWRAAKRLAKQDKAMSGSAGKEHEVDRNGNTENSELITDKDKDSGRDSTNSPNISKSRRSSSKFFKSEAHKYLHRPSSFLQAVKLPLIRSNEKSECKARKTLGVIMSAFIITWLPFFSLAILKSCFGVPVPPWLDGITLWLGYSNSTLNPMIYCKYNKDYRTPFREMLSCRCRTLQTVMRQNSFRSRYGPTVNRQSSENGPPRASDV